MLAGANLVGKCHKSAISIMKNAVKTFNKERWDCLIIPEATTVNKRLSVTRVYEHRTN